MPCLEEAKRVEEETKRQSLPVNDPNRYKRTPGGIDLNTDLEDIYTGWDDLIPSEELPQYEEMVRFLMRDELAGKPLEKRMVALRRRFKCIPKKSQLIYAYQSLVGRGGVVPDAEFRGMITKKGSKSQSGVLVVTVLTSPYPEYGVGEKRKKQRFSCQWNCYYCPNEPDQPRSYLHDEPSVLRANRNGFDPVLQFYDRAMTLFMNGHPVDKIELLVLGGTWASYPHQYQEEFIRDLFYAANTFYEPRNAKRERTSLDEEKSLNESATCKIIGITLETRPDCITPEEIRRFRRYGCTRVQLGVQHTNEGVLKHINRGCTTRHAERAIRLLKDCCYKMDIHLMPNLPGSNPQLDRDMFNEVLHGENLQVDQWKIYPCEVTPWTVIKKWYDEGTFKPYPDEQLIDVLLDVKAQVHPWIRLNRVVRDIPSQYILGGLEAPNLRQAITKTLVQRGTPCRCIRCREVKDNARAVTESVLKERRYRASGGDEIFLSFETPDEATICGFLRLRLCKTPGVDVDTTADDGEEDKSERTTVVFPELEGCALIRELHVYGQLKAVVTRNQRREMKKNAMRRTEGENKDEHAQHVGFGSQLMHRAECLAWDAGFRKVAVIAGVGVRNFYRKLGYELVEGDESEMLIKTLACRPKGAVRRRGGARGWGLLGGPGAKAASCCVLVGLLAVLLRSNLWGRLLSSRKISEK